VAMLGILIWERYSSRESRGLQGRSYIAHGSLVGSRGEAPVGAEAVCRHCLQILTAEPIKI